MENQDTENEILTEDEENEAFDDALTEELSEKYGKEIEKALKTLRKQFIQEYNERAKTKEKKSVLEEFFAELVCQTLE